MQPQRHQSAARRKAALGSLLFLAIAPGVVAGLLPWCLTGWDSAEGLPLPVSVAGVLVVAVGVVVLLHAFARFVVEGLGTPAPVAPTRGLVAGGLYRYVRNPMYLAVAATIVGQAMILGRPVLLLYGAAFGIAVGSFVHFYEEPTLARQFGAEYEAYRRAVPAWLPRRQPWSPNDPPLQRPRARR
jgi:protein-S-isoprenylcysteine O-methyltransferase Ste14